MKRREFIESSAASVALSPLSQIDVRPEDGDDEQVEVMFRMSRRRLEELRERGEVYQPERGIWMFVREEHSEF